MSVSEWFKDFNQNIRFSQTTVDTIRSRYKSITKRINADFRNLNSDTDYSWYVGSYGRGTEIGTSDIDVLVQLPYSQYQKYNDYQSNGQSALLQAVRNSIAKTYSTTHLRGDGQVVVIEFADGIRYEVVPGFIQIDGLSYTYPDTNNGGSWKTTKPKQEISAINDRNDNTNRNLKRLCRMAREWKATNSIDMGGLLIDTLAYNFIEYYTYRDKSYLYYDYMSRDFFLYLSELSTTQIVWYAPGSRQAVYKTGNFISKAKDAHGLALEAIEKEKDYPFTAKSKWRAIYGSCFPA